MTSSEAERADIATDLGLAGSWAVFLLGRRVVISIATAVSAAVVARELGASDFGTYASALAVVALGQAVADMGFSTVMLRDLPQAVAERRALLTRSTVQVHLMWSAVVGLALAVAGLASGLDTARGQVLLVLAPTMLLAFSVSLRQVLIVGGRVRLLARIDVPVNLAQAAAIVVAALLGASVLEIALLAGAGYSLNALLVIAQARRFTPPAPHRGTLRREITRAAVPLGVASLLSSLYFTIDLVVLTWLVDAPEVGLYAAAVKILNVLVLLPSTLLNIGLPAMAVSTGDRVAFARAAGRVWTWVVALGLPAVLGILVFSDEVVRLVYGSEYEAAARLLRILCAAGLLSFLGSVLSGALIAHKRARAQLLLNVGVLAGNLGANLALVPVYGVEAAAWITLGTEVAVCAGLAALLRSELDLMTMLAPSARVAAPAALAALVALAVPGALLALAAAAVAYAGALVALRAWPPELSPRRARAS